MAFADLYAARTATVRVPAKSAREIASITEYWYISRLTVAATSIHALSAVTKITRLVLIMPPAFDSLYRVIGSLLMPDANDRNVSLMFDAKPAPGTVLEHGAAAAASRHRCMMTVIGSCSSKYAGKCDKACKAVGQHVGHYDA